MSSSVSVVRRLENVETRARFDFLHNNLLRFFFFSYAYFQRSQKRHCYKLY